MERLYRTIFGFWALAFILITAQLRSQTAGGANGMVFRFTKQVWLNPTIILAKQSFEQSTNVKLLILPRVNGNDTTGSSRIEKAFDKLLSFLVFKENVQGSIKFYFNPKNPTKPFTFNTSDELFCKFTPIQKDSVETILNQDIVNNANLNNFTALPFDSIINRASRYCKKILQSKPGLCGENPGNEFTLTKINSTPAKLNFEKGLNPNAAAPNGGVDRKKYAELEQYYNTVLDVADNSNYPLAWKAMAANTSDVIKLKLKKKENYFDISKLVFKNANGTETYNVTYNNIGRDSIIDLSISGKSPGSMTEVVAYYTPTTTPTQTFAIGAFNVQFYQPKTLNVVLVNLGGITLPDANAIKDSLNKIYGQAFVKWNVTTATCPLPVSANKNIHIESSSLLSNYMPDMQPIVSYFKDKCTAYNSSSDNTYYLLFGATNDSDPVNKVTGYMPRARNTGFIFDTDVRTIAHELGHGAFNLKHIFDSDDLGEGSKKQTDNLMDYVIATRLYKHQWDLIHNPGFVGWFEGDDDDGSSVSVSDLSAFQDFKNPENNTYTFIAPSGRYVTLPADVRSVRFSTFDRLFYVDSQEPSNSMLPLGSLMSFVDKDGKLYNANVSGPDFMGYKLKETGNTGNTYYKDKYTMALNPGSGIALFIGYTDNKAFCYVSRFASTITGQTNTDSTARGALLNKFSVLDISASDSKKQLHNFLTEKKSGSYQLNEVKQGYTIQLANEDVLLEYNVGALKTVGQFLADVLDQNSTIEEYVAYFTLVNMKQSDFQGFSDCITKRYEDELNRLKVTIHTALSAIQFGENGLTTAPQIMAGYKAKIVQTLVSEAQSDLQILPLLNAATTAAAIKQVFTDHPSISICALSGLTISNRIALLNLLLGGSNPDEDYWFVENNVIADNEKFIVQFLIESTPKADHLTLINNGIKADNYRWMRNLWAEYDSFFNDVEIEQLGYLCVYINNIITENYPQLNINPKSEQATVSTSLFDTKQVTILPGRDKLYLVGFKSGVLHYFGLDPDKIGTIKYDLYASEEAFTSSGKIKLNQFYTTTQPSTSVLYPDDVVGLEMYNYEYDPLEPVTIKIMNYFYEENYPQGTEITTTAFMAMWYAKNIEKIQSDRLKRTVYNSVVIGIGIIAAPFSGGTSMVAADALVVAGTLAASADISISYIREHMSEPDYNNNKVYFEAWDKTKMTIDMANAVTGAIQLSRSFATNFNGLRTLKTVSDQSTKFANLTNTQLNSSAVVTIKDRLNAVTKILNNQTVIAEANNAGFTSKLFESTTIKIVKSLDDPNIGIIAGHDGTPLTQAVFNVLKQGNNFEEGLQFGNGFVRSPKTPLGFGGRTCSAAELAEMTTYAESRIQTAGATNLIRNTQLAKQGPELSAKYFVDASGALVTVQNFTLIGTVQKYVLQASSPAASGMMVVLTQANGQPKLVYCSQEVFEEIYKQKKAEQDCKACQTVDELTCIKFQALIDKAGAAYLGGINKLCQQLGSLPSKIPVNDVLDELLLMNPIDCRLFLTDINATAPPPGHVSTYVSGLNKGKVQAWKIIHEAKSAVSPNYRVDNVALVELSQAMSTPSFTQNIGGVQGISTILKANKYLPCSTCQNSNKFLQKTDQYILDLKYFSNNYNNADIWTDIKQLNAIKKVYGAAFQLRVLRTQPSLFIGGTVSFDLSLFDDLDADNPGDDDPDPNEFRSKCRFDIKVVKPTGNSFFEFKSWSNNFANTFLSTPGKRTAFARQLQSYLSNVNNLSQLKYIFDGERISEEKAKELLQKVFQDNADAWFDGTSQADIVFKNKLQTLFNVTTKQNFISKINNLQELTIYKFVKTY